MDSYLKIVWLVGVAAAQYDYTPPQKAFNAGGGGGSSSPGKERRTYGLPGHTPGAPQGLSDFASAAPSGYSSPATRTAGGGGLSIPDRPNIFVAWLRQHSNVERMIVCFFATYLRYLNLNLQFVGFYIVSHPPIAMKTKEEALVNDEGFSHPTCASYLSSQPSVSLQFHYLFSFTECE
jgi:hypothetical protein